MLKWHDLQPLTAGLHIARSVYLPSTTGPLHGHDFAEICWVVSGRIRHATPSAQQDLVAGDVLLIEPKHRHRLEGVRGGGAVMNVAFPAPLLRALARRWGGGGWPFTGGAEPARYRLSDDAMAAIMRRSTELIATRSSGVDDGLVRDLLLGEIIRALRPPDPTPWHDAPDWLARALQAWAQPRHLRAGVSALPALTGRSREHVARAIRKACGRSPTALLQELRLGAAETRLRTSDEDLATIAAACGYAGRAHFHRLFRAKFGVTPGVYRRQARQTLVS